LLVVAGVPAWDYDNRMKKIITILFLLIVSVSVHGLPDKGSTGITASFVDSSSWIGWVYHTADFAMIRPSVLVSYDLDGRDYLGVEMDLLRLKPTKFIPDNFSFWGPGLRFYYYQTAEYEDVYDSEGYWIDSTEVYIDNYSASLSWTYGSQIMIHPGMGVFGQVKLSARVRFSSDEGFVFSTRTAAIGLGAVLYYK
jgi:hypothetical protein